MATSTAQRGRSLLGKSLRWIHLAGFAGVPLRSWEHARMAKQD